MFDPPKLYICNLLQSPLDFPAASYLNIWINQITAMMSNAARQGSIRRCLDDGVWQIYCVAWHMGLKEDKFS